MTRIDALRDAARKVRGRTPFHIDARVVLPDHMHRVWTPAFEHVKKSKLSGDRAQTTLSFPAQAGTHASVARDFSSSCNVSPS